MRPSSIQALGTAATSGLEQADLDVRIGLGVAPHQRWQDAVVGRADERQRQIAGLSIAHPLGQARQAVKRRQDFQNMRKPLLAQGGQADAALGSLEQRRAQVALQAHDRLAERRLGHAQPLRRAAEVQGLSHGDEVAERASVH
jgi:hypothetical protein